MTTYRELLRLTLPEIVVVAAGLAVLAADLLWLRKCLARVRFATAAGVASFGCIAAILLLVRHPAQGNLFNGMLLANPLTSLVQIALLVLAIFTLALSVDSDFTSHVGEYVLLVLAATIGGMFLVATKDLLVIFVALELLSLSLYALTAFDKDSAQSSEAGMKYFLFGGMASAFLLFGFSLLYGLSNSTSLTVIAAAIHGPVLNPLLAVAIITTVLGVGFKVAAAPFHFWAPDVYEGAPIPVAAFIASSSKVAGFFLFMQLMVLGFAGAEGSAAWGHIVPGWVPVLAAVAALSMVLGSLVAIVQTSVRRLLAYSAIAHAGYMLLGIVAHTQQSMAALLYYVATYALATLGSFGVISLVHARTGGDRISDFAGLSRRAPLVSGCMLVFMLSLAGFPPLAGFFGKFYLFLALLNAPGSTGLLWLVLLAVAASAVSLYYYLKVLKAMYVTDAAADADMLKPSFLSQLCLFLLAAAVVLLGCAPQALLHWLLAAISASH
jgi:NADH-quinone oxidoreductase subunit N